MRGTPWTRTGTGPEPVQGERDSLDQYWYWSRMGSLQAEGAGLLHGGEQLVVQRGEGGVRGEVQAVETRVSPETHRQQNFKISEP